METNDPFLVSEAMESIQRTIVAAKNLTSAMKALKPIRITYLYDHTMNKWLPLHAVTSLAGIITDRPRLVALEGLSDLSVCGSAKSKELQQ